jgi:hypothetical protein
MLKSARLHFHENWIYCYVSFYDWFIPCFENYIDNCQIMTFNTKFGIINT